MIENLEKMTNYEIRKLKVKLATEKSKKGITKDFECENYKKRRERQIYQAKFMPYIFASVIASIISDFIGDFPFTADISLLVYAMMILMLIYLILIYLIIPKLTSKRILTYRTRFNIPVFIYFFIQMCMFYTLYSEGSTEIDKTALLVILFLLIGIPITFIQNRLEKRVYEEREKDIFQKFSWNDWYSEMIFEYEHMNEEELNAKRESVLKIEEQISICNQELRARKMESRLTEGDK